MSAFTEIYIHFLDIFYKIFSKLLVFAIIDIVAENSELENWVLLVNGEDIDVWTFSIQLL